MAGYLQNEKDDLPMLEAGPWVSEKLDYLRRYINIFETSMRLKPWRKRHYIDLFAGPGKCYVPENDAIYLGSPLLALTTNYPFTDNIFVDQNPQNIAALRERCASYQQIDQIQFWVGDSNVVVEKIVIQILSIDHERLPDKWSSLNLAFLDPFGLELRWETVAKLAEPYSMDLIIHYPEMGIRRMMPIAFKENATTLIDEFFGGFEWRNVYEKFQRREERFISRVLLDHYKDKLQGLGYREVFRDDEIGDEPLIRNAKRNAPLYRLLFASKNPLGHDFWQKVIRRDVHGQARMF